MSVTKPWEDPAIAGSIYAERAREVAALYTRFADDLAFLVMPGDSRPNSVLRSEVIRAHEIASDWSDVARALEDGPAGQPAT